MVDCSIETHQPLHVWKILSCIFMYACMCVYSLSSGVKPTHQAAVVSKIDSRLEQYTSAIEVRDVQSYGQTEIDSDYRDDHRNT